MRFIIWLKESWNLATTPRNSVLKFTTSGNHCYQRTWLTARFYHATASHHAATDFYSVLKVPRGSTQAQIKSAYYKLCMEHHPDTNQGCPKAQQEFAKIAEAYSVLGQIESRRKYDREILQQYPRSPRTTFTQPNRFTHSFKTGYGKGPQFNFDEFYRAHYRNIKQWESERKRVQFGIPKRNIHNNTEDFSEDAFITLGLILTFFILTGAFVLRYGKDL